MAIWQSCALAGFVLGAVLSLPANAGDSECRDIATRYAEVKGDAASPVVNGFLIEAAEGGCRELVEELLAAGGSIAMRGREGASVLHHAAQAGEDEIVELLIERGGAIDLRDLKGATPLSYAVEANRMKTAKLLLDRGANPDVEGHAGVTPLEAAAFNGSDRIVEMLLKQGVDVRHVDRTGKSAIVYAAARAFTSIVSNLIAAGVDVNARYGNDLTVLMWAAGHPNDVPDAEGVATIKLLLDNGAHIDDQDNRGRTALMIAAELSHGGAVEFLLSRGANPKLTDKEGKAARDLAANEEIKLALSR
jgi:ankyrin repeat protein